MDCIAKRLLYAAAATAGAALTLGLAVAQAQASPYPPSLPCATTISPAVLHAGETLHIVSTGFTPNKSAQIVLHSAPITLANVVADKTGTADVYVHIPSDVEPGPHTLIVEMPNRTCTLAVNAVAGGTSPGSTSGVDGSAVAAPVKTSAGSSLPYTGFAAAGAVIIAAALLGGGLFFLAIGRRRRAGMISSRGRPSRL